jgi:hypothetical protein
MTDRIKQYNSQRFQSTINTDVSMIDDAGKKLIERAMNKEWTNPKYKLRWFVGQQQITPFSKYRQWLLELKSKEESLENMEYEIAKLQVEYDRYKRIKDNSDDDLDKRLADIEMWKTDRSIYMSKRRIQDWYLERQHLIDLIEEFMASDEAKLPDGSGRTYADVLDTEEEDVYEAQYWTNRLAKQAACDMLFYGRIGTGNMDAILSMSPEQQAETLALTVNFSTQLQSYQTRLQNEATQMLQMQQAGDNKDLTFPTSAHLINDGSTQNTQPAVVSNDAEDLLNVYSIRNTSE